MLRDDAWGLDLLGNWTRRLTQTDTDPTPEFEIGHLVNHRNEIGTITHKENGQTLPETDVRYDAAMAAAQIHRPSATSPSAACATRSA